VYELTSAVSVTKVVAFALNVAAVVYLIVAKRLFAVRGGQAAYERELEGESLLEVREAGEDTSIDGHRDDGRDVGMSGVGAGRSERAATD
jgi:hypothetical protein